MESRKFTREVKLEAVRRIKDRGVSYVQTADLSLHVWQLREWVKRFAEGPQHSFRRQRAAVDPNRTFVSPAYARDHCCTQPPSPKILEELPDLRPREGEPCVTLY